MIYDERDLPRPSMLDSMVAARNNGILQSARIEGYRDGHNCKYCDGSMYYDFPNFGVSRCICWTMQKEEKFRKVQQLATRHRKLEWKDFEVWGDSASKTALNNALSTCRDWLSKIDSWLLLGGTVGTGKSHLLHTLDTYLYPWSFYVSVPDLKDLVFEYTAKKDLQMVTDTIARHPILIMDDIGAEYESDYAISMVRQIIMTRYKMWEEYPVVIATNLTKTQLTKYDERLMDRLYDQDKVRHVSFKGVSSWRQRHND
jgi:DNA replication protein DnaC